MQCISALRAAVAELDDTPVQKIRKSSLFALSVGSVTAGLLVILALVFRGDPHLLWVFWICVYVISIALGTIAFLIVRRKATTTMVTVVMSLYLLIILVQDWHGARTGSIRCWPLAVLVFDCLITCRVPQKNTSCFLLATSVWVIITSFEDTVRWGLYDIFSHEGIYEERRERACSCHKLPCPQLMSEGLIYIVVSLMVFIMDYFITRGFANAVLEEKQKVEAAIEVADQVALSLAKFDLEAARERLKKSSDLPEPLHATFTNILSNLEAYRPFLPDALFDELHATGSNTDLQRAATPPGTLTDNACLVFTDIQGSTSTWEACPDGMKRGLRIHNSIIRGCINSCNGYEVKTIGDSFMVAFDTAAEGCRFGVEAQRCLYEAPWPSSLLEVPHCSRDEERKLCGLRVRIGVHYGPVVAELNRITGRFDYFGTTVNVAARIESVCGGGTAAVTDAVLEEVQGMWDDVVEIPIGAARLKGVAEETNFTLLLPRELAGRREQAVDDARCRAFPSRYTQRQSTAMLTAPNEDQTQALTISSASMPQAIHFEIREHLDRMSSVSTASVQVDVSGSPHEVQSLASDRLTRVVNCLTRTEGTVISLVGVRLAVGWNTSRRCHTHFLNSMQFLDLLFFSLRREEESSVSVGLASSSALCGNLGASTQRFMTVIGPCMTLAPILAATASELKTLCIFSSVNLKQFLTNNEETINMVMRPVVRFQPLSHGDAVIGFEVACDQLSRSPLLRMGGFSDPSTDGSEVPWGWSAAYREAFEVGDAGIIMTQAMGDQVLLAASRMAQPIPVQLPHLDI